MEKTSSKKKAMQKKHESESEAESDSSSDNEETFHYVESPPPSFPSSRKKDLVFYIDFHDGYAFRQIMEFLKLTVTTVPMYFTENGISILQGNGDGSLVVSINIKGHELLTYYFNPEFANFSKKKSGSRPSSASSSSSSDSSVSSSSSESNEQSYHVISFNVSKFRDTIKSTARKEGIRIFQYHGDPTVHIQVYGGNKNGEGGTSIETQGYSPLNYDLSGFEQSLLTPNCKSPLSEFCNSCGHFGKVKSTKYTNFTCYKSGVKVTACSETGVISMFKKWGDCEEDSEHPFRSSGPKLKLGDSSKSTVVHNVKIPIEIVKALSKLSNLTNNGIIRIYCEEDKIIRFMVSVSYYAELVIYWKEPEGDF
jgi:hypothetical protein